MPVAGLKLHRVLVVDDVALNREIFISLLGDAARHVDEAEDGRAALTLFKQIRYDAVLLDIEMPVLDGYGVMKEIRLWEREQCLPPTPVVAITSSDFPEDEQRILAAGATAYLLKPLNPQALMAALRLHCLNEPSLHPMASLLPRFFAYAGIMMEELVGLEELPAIAKKLHQLRGMVAVYGFKDFAERLREIDIAAQRGIMPEPVVLKRLQNELNALEKATLLRP